MLREWRKANKLPTEEDEDSVGRRQKMRWRMILKRRIIEEEDETKECSKEG